MKIKCLKKELKDSYPKYYKIVRELQKLNNSISESLIELSPNDKYNDVTHIVIVGLFYAYKKTFDACMLLANNGYFEDLEILTRKNVFNFISLAFILGKRSDKYLKDLEIIFGEKVYRLFDDPNFLAKLYVYYGTIDRELKYGEVLRYHFEHGPSDLFEKSDINTRLLEYKKSPTMKNAIEARKELKRDLTGLSDNETHEGFDKFIKSMKKSEWPGIDIYRMFDSTILDEQKVPFLYEYVYRTTLLKVHYTDIDDYVDYQNDNKIKRKRISWDGNIAMALLNEMSVSSFMVLLIINTFHFDKYEAKIQKIFEYINR